MITIIIKSNFLDELMKIAIDTSNISCKDENLTKYKIKIS